MHSADERFHVIEMRLTALEDVLRLVGAWVTEAASRVGLEFPRPPSWAPREDPALRIPWQDLQVMENLDGSVPDVWEDLGEEDPAF